MHRTPVCSTSREVRNPCWCYRLVYNPFSSPLIQPQSHGHVHCINDRLGVASIGPVYRCCSVVPGYPDTAAATCRCLAPVRPATPRGGTTCRSARTDRPGCNVAAQGGGLSRQFGRGPSRPGATRTCRRLLPSGSAATAGISRSSLQSRAVPSRSGSAGGGGRTFPGGFAVTTGLRHGL